MDSQQAPEKLELGSVWCERLGNKIARFLHTSDDEGELICYTRSDIAEAEAKKKVVELLKQFKTYVDNHTQSFSDADEGFLCCAVTESDLHEYIDQLIQKVSV